MNVHKRFLSFFAGFLSLASALSPLPAHAQGSVQLSDVYAKFQQTQDPEQAIALGDQALAIEATLADWPLSTPRDAFKVDVFSGLGRAYVNRWGGVRADNIEAAIRNFEAVLPLVSPQPGSDAAAVLHVNLGVAYWNRIRGDRGDSEERALSQFETALTTFSRDSHPQQWAQVQMNMSAVYLTRRKGSRDGNIEAAISRLEGALTVLTRDSQPQLWAAAHNNLGEAYLVRIQGETADNLKMSITHFGDALQVFTREAAPFQWAQVQVSLAAAVHSQKPVGEGGDSDAMAHLRAALQIFTQEASPEQWARTQYQLGNFLADRTDGDQATNLRDAAAAYRAALMVFTREAAPLLHLQIARRLGNTLMLAGDCKHAGPIYASARQAFLLLFGQGLNTSEVSVLVAEAGPMFADAAYCAAERGEIDQAVQLANEGRARLLSVSLKLQSLDLSSQQRQRLDELRVAIRADQSLVDASSGPDREAALNQLIAKRQELLALVESAKPREALPQSAVDLAREISDGDDVILMPVVTMKGTKMLFFAGGTSKTWTAVDFPDVTLARITEVLVGKSKEATHGWIEAYFANYFDDEEEQQRRWPQWLAAIDHIGLELWDLFGNRLAHTFAAQGVKPATRLILLPSGRLGVLPLGLAQDPVSKRRLVDSHDIVYASSLDALVSAHRAIKKPIEPSLAAVINPTGDLPGTEKEGAAVASHFAAGARTMLQRGAASSTAVLEALKGKTYWHFASHGTFAWRDVGNSALIMSGQERLSVARLAEADGLGQPRLVVLSACETGLSQIDTLNPDEFIGLPGAFSALGAAGVVGTLWPVSDDATALIMAKFYELHLAKGMSPPAALRQAQLWLRDATADTLNQYAAAMRLEDGQSAPLISAASGAADTRPFSHPYYWGGFVYTGL